MTQDKKPIDVPNADIYLTQDPNKLKAQDLNKGTGVQRVSAGDPGSNELNIHRDLETRGNGAATKGRKARGPMA